MKKRSTVYELLERAGRPVLPRERPARIVDADGDPVTIQDLRRIRRRAKKNARKNLK